ncbi:MAG: hypothetical protein AAFP23_05700, partial [Pseudomonadota bacterium]
RGDTVNGAPVALIAALFEEPEGGAAQVEIPGGAGVAVGQVVEILPLDPDFLAERATSLESALGASLARDQAAYFAAAVESAQETTVDGATVQSVYELLGAHQTGVGGQGGAM